jgi:hypothetical protein
MGGETQPMTPPAELMQQLRAMRARADEADVESAMTRNQWLADVDALMRAIRSWLTAAAREGLVQMDLSSVRIAEDDLGAYEAPALKLTFPGPRHVWVRPIGTLHVGARGIVDMVCGSNRALIVLNRAGRWKVRSSGATTSALDMLDENTFARALTELIL